MRFTLPEGCPCCSEGYSCWSQHYSSKCIRLVRSQPGPPASPQVGALLPLIRPKFDWHLPTFIRPICGHRTARWALPGLPKVIEQVADRFRWGSCYTDVRHPGRQGGEETVRLSFAALIDAGHRDSARSLARPGRLGDTSQGVRCGNSPSESSAAAMSWSSSSNKSA
jgi:hypothetical protein